MISAKFRVDGQWVENPIPLKQRLSVYLKTSRNPDWGSGVWKHDKWQIEDMLVVIDPDTEEVMLLRNRGGSKTRDGVEMAVFLGYQTNRVGDWRRVIWYASNLSQLEQALEYFQQSNYVDEKHSSQSKKRLWNGNIIKIRPLSDKQASSPRSDDIFFDEEQDAVEKNYGKALGTLVGAGKTGRMIHMGTTQLDSVLERNYIKLLPRGRVLEHHIEDCSWTTVEEELKKFEGMPDFVVQSQLFCKWVRPGGQVFTKLEEGIIPVSEGYPKHFGVDPNPKAGHALVRSRWFPEKQIIYIDKEYPAETDSFKFCRELQKEIRNENSYCEIEWNNGEEFLKIYHETCGLHDYDHVSVIKWTEENKHNRIYGMRTNLIVIHPACVETLRQFREAVWNPREPKARLLKTPTQHYLDAGIHSCNWFDATYTKVYV